MILQLSLFLKRRRFAVNFVPYLTKDNDSMSVGFQVHIGRDLVASETYSGLSPCSRSEGKALLERLYTSTCNTYKDLKTRQDFRNAIDGAKRAIDNAAGGADAASTRGFYNKEIATNLGYVRVDVEIYRGNGHFRS